MLTLGHTLVLGGREFTSHAVHVRCERAVAPGVGRLRVRLPYVGGLPAAVGDDVRLDLDSGDVAAGSATVFTGTITALRHGPAGVDVHAGDASWALAHYRPAITYEGQTAGGVVGALAGEAGASTATLDDGPTLPAYVADGATTGWEHIARLAAWSGADAYVTADGDVTLRARDASSVDAALRWGREVLAAGSTDAPLPASGVADAGEGPGPADDRPGAFRFTATGAPPAAPVAVRYRPGLRATDVTRVATTSWMTREATRRRPIELLTFLLPALGPGDLVEVRDAPVPLSLLQVRRVEHRVDAAGARTRIVARAGAGSDLLGQLGSLLGNPAGAVGGLL
ncbi:hypothetical protein [Frankia sp. QA3]|uniref:hypothetical protein n=1 Tax=Frankia sp. QA3 TaxID=710111 RepID=UPI000269BC8A|nr:hypothetical protein [Frankia sp. QA3]EIV92704.1 hypothetical protein FraQA3DRAFT_2314 [Frankia sp. QA3]